MVHLNSPHLFATRCLNVTYFMGLFVSMNVTICINPATDVLLFITYHDLANCKPRINSNILKPPV